MSSDAIRDSAFGLAWSLWTELGVPGVSRNHAHTVLDPEPLIMATPVLAAGDPRLMEQAFGWCSTHSSRISASRLKGLLSGAQEQVASQFSAFSRAMQVRGVKWPIIGQADSMSAPARLPSPPLPTERPSLLRFRLRALCGVGARADVLSELLASSGAWRSAAELARLGYTKRNVTRVLSELVSAGIVSNRKEGNSLRYRLERPAPLEELAGGGGLVAPAWQPQLGLVTDLLGLIAQEHGPASVRRVEANKARDLLAANCHSIGAQTPPRTRGNPDAWEDIIDWGTRLVSEMATGSSPYWTRRA
jgi:DNA-binding transcriptional ArsR family regulator